MRVFGGLSLEGPDGPLEGRIVHRHPLALLALLAAGCDGLCTRDKVIGLLWGEYDERRARHALADTLYRIRQGIGKAVIRSLGASLQLDTDVLWTDVGAFETALERGDFAAAAGLCRGPFLDGFHLPGAPDFERWSDLKRQSFERRCGDALVALAEGAESEGGFADAVSWWRRLMERHPYDAVAALRLSEALCAIGDRAEALTALLDFERRLEQDLGVEPDATVMAARERLASNGVSTPPRPAPRHVPADRAGAAAPGAVPHRAPSGSAAPPAAVPRPRWRRPGVTIALVAASLTLGVVGLRSFVPTRRPPLDPDQIVIPTFARVSDAVDTVVASGLSRLVSLTLDGAGPLRCIQTMPPGEIGAGVSTPGSAERIARATGAGLVLFANVAPVGGDSLSVSAVLYDAVAHDRLAAFTVGGRYDDPLAIADRLAVRAMRHLARLRRYGAWHLSSVGSESPRAIREFLRAEWHMRRFQLTDARRHYQLAVAADSGFALALRGLAEAEMWQRHHLKHHQGGSRRPAGVVNHGLALRESLLLTADSLFGAIVADETLPAPPALVQRLLLTIGDWTEAYPGDPEAWYRLGDAALHLGSLAGLSDRDARAAFERAIEIDPGYAPPYLHKLQLELVLDGSERALSTARAFVALDPDPPWAEAIGIVIDAIDPQRASTRGAALALADLAGRARPRYLPNDPATFSVLVASQLTMWSTEPGAPGLRIARAWGYPNAVALAAAYRGRLAEAYAALRSDTSAWLIPGTSRDAFFAALARLGAPAGDTVAVVLRRWLEARDPWGAYHALPWWAATGDTASVAEAAALFESIRGDSLQPMSVLASYGAAAARAYGALSRGDTATAIEQFSRLGPWCRLPECHHESLTLARLLAARGRHREALHQLGRVPIPRHLPPAPETVLIAYERARLEEHLGEDARAAQSYRLVVQAWDRADQALQGIVEEARAGLRRVEAGAHPPTP